MSEDREHWTRGLLHALGRYGWISHYLGCRRSFGMSRRQAIGAAFAAYWTNWRDS